MSFYNKLKQYQNFDFNGYLKAVSTREVESAINKEFLEPLDFLTLISDTAVDQIEIMAQKAKLLTKRQFGNVIFIFTPLYISNYCVNSCPYCSFAGHHKIDRKQLSLKEIEDEAKKISESGIRHILLLTGESQNITTVEYIRESVHILEKYFSSIAIEVYPMDSNNYDKLIKAGIDSLTVYQEVYNEKRYKELHVKGPKSDYLFRLNAPERALKKGIRAVTIGALLGLDNPIIESFFTALHLQYLTANFPEAEISISLPRLRPLISEFKAKFSVSDKKFVQLLLAFRLFQPSCGITISTREEENFRNSILPLGVTKMSAGVSTEVGGYSNNNSTGQFEIADKRSVQELINDLKIAGYQPVMHDWNYKLFQEKSETTLLYK